MTAHARMAEVVTHGEGTNGVHSDGIDREGGGGDGANGGDGEDGIAEAKVRERAADGKKGLLTVNPGPTPTPPTHKKGVKVEHIQRRSCKQVTQHVPQISLIIVDAEGKEADHASSQRRRQWRMQ